MKTYWTHPQKGATLLELFILFVDSNFTLASATISVLKNRYGGDTRTGLAISSDSLAELSEIDAERAMSPIMAEYVKENFEYDKIEAAKPVICIRCKNKKEVIK